MLKLFGDKNPIIAACEKSEIGINTLPGGIFQEIYLLTHPYYGLTGNESYFSHYHSRLLQSIAQIRKRGLNTLGILTLEGDEKFEFSKRNPIQKYIHELLKRMQMILGNNLHVRIQTQGFYEKGVHELPLKFHDNTLISARGIWGNRCVLTTLEDFIHVHDLPEERSLLVTAESLFPNEDDFPVSQKGFFSIAELRKKGKLRVGYSISG